MPRSATTGRYTARRPRLVGVGRRFRIRDADFTKGADVAGVITGEPITIGGGPAPEPEPKPKAADRKGE